jgi:hypothetical protein
VKFVAIVKAGMAGEPYAANGNARYETQFRNERCHNRKLGVMPDWQGIREYEITYLKIMNSPLE